jgi:hypothetical protein
MSNIVMHALEYLSLLGINIPSSCEANFASDCNLIGVDGAHLVSVVIMEAFRTAVLESGFESQHPCPPSSCCSVAGQMDYAL